MLRSSGLTGIPGRMLAQAGDQDGYSPRARLGRMSRTMRVYAVVLTMALVAVGSTQYLATTVERFSIEELSLRSQMIIQGVVRGSRSFWTADRKLILTATTFEVTESIKGQAVRIVEVTTVGGQVDDTVLHVSGMPSFTAGENVVLFMERSGIYTTVFGLGQGKFTISNNAVVNSVADLNFADGAPPRETRMPLQSFKNAIRTAIQRGERGR